MPGRFNCRRAPAHAPAATTPHARALLDIGCGAGNYSLKLLGRLPNLDATLIDLSGPMLERAVQRVAASTAGRVDAVQGDAREIWWLTKIRQCTRSCGSKICT